MKKVIIAAALVFCGNAMYAQTTTTATPPPMQPAQARPMPTPENMAKMQTERLNTQVKLSDDQSKSVYKANLDFATKMQAARQNRDMNAFKTVMQDRDAAYQKILTADQYKTYQQQNPHMMQAGGRPGMTTAPTMSPAAPTTTPSK